MFGIQVQISGGNSRRGLGAPVDGTGKASLLNSEHIIPEHSAASAQRNTDKHCLELSWIFHLEFFDVVLTAVALAWPYFHLVAWYVKYSEIHSRLGSMEVVGAFLS